MSLAAGVSTAVLNGGCDAGSRLPAGRQPHLACHARAACRLEVTVRAQRMPDVPVTGVLGANMAWQRKKSG